MKFQDACLIFKLGTKLSSPILGRVFYFREGAESIFDHKNKMHLDPVYLEYFMVDDWEVRKI